MQGQDMQGQAMQGQTMQGQDMQVQAMQGLDMQGQTILLRLTKTDGGATVQLHAFLISTLDGKAWSPRTGLCSVREKLPLTIEWEAGWAS